MTTENPEAGALPDVMTLQCEASDPLRYCSVSCARRRAGVDECPPRTDRPAPESPTDAEALASEQRDALAELTDRILFDPEDIDVHDDALFALVGRWLKEERAQAEQREAKAVRAALDTVTKRVEQVLTSERYNYADQYSRPGIVSEARKEIRAALAAERGSKQ